MNFLRLIRRRVLAGADGPHRLVRDDRLLHRSTPARSSTAAELPRNDLHRLASLPLIQRFADAQDRDQPLRLRRQEFARHQRVVFLIYGATLGMTDDHVPATDILQHGGGHFAGEGADRFGARRLRAERDARGLQQPRRLPTGRRTADTRRYRPSADRASPAADASISSAFSARDPCIFQFPAIRGRRIAIPQVSLYHDVRRCAGTPPRRARKLSDAPARKQTGHGPSADNAGRSEVSDESGQARRSRRRTAAQAAAFAADATQTASSLASLAHQFLVAAFDHDADHRFGARRTQDDPARSRRGALRPVATAS